MFNGLAIIRKWAADHKIQDTTKRLQPKAPDSLSLSGHQLGSPLRYHLQCSSKVPGGVEAALTQTVTHIGFGLGGNNGTVSVQQHLHPQRKGYKIAQWNGKRLRSAAHNPEVEGSNPSPATIKVPHSVGMRYFFSLFRPLVFCVSNTFLTQRPAKWSAEAKAPPTFPSKCLPSVGVPSVLCADKYPP